MLLVYPFGFVELYGVYPRAVVTSDDEIPVIYPESFTKSETFVGTVGISSINARVPSALGNLTATFFVKLLGTDISTLLFYLLL